MLVPQEPTDRPSEPVAEPEPIPAPAPIVLALPTDFSRKPWLRRKASEENRPEDEKPTKPFWNKIGVLDIAVVLIMVKLTDMVWVYAINNV